MPLDIRSVYDWGSRGPDAGRGHYRRGRGWKHAYRPGDLPHVPGLRDSWTHGLWEPACCDSDVAALHAAYLRHAKTQGAILQCNSRLHAASWADNAWHISAGGFACSAGIIINAAGAWADDVARIAGIGVLGIQPYRRTIAQLAVSPQVPADLPLVIGLDGSFYFKPDSGGRLWLSPHDESATPACDAAPEEMDVAIAIDRLQQVVDWEIRRVEHKWAGLRSFAPDRLPVRWSMCCDASGSATRSTASNCPNAAARVLR